MQESNPLISYDSIVLDGSRVQISTFHNCLTALKEYENKSLEELRWEDYLLNKKTKLTGSSKCAYKPTLGADLKQGPGILFCKDTKITAISAMLEYENQSFEELRYEDYLIGNKQKPLNDKKYTIKIKKPTVSENTQNKKPEKEIKPDEDESSCPICLETITQIKQDKKKLMVTICGHVLCDPCLESMTNRMLPNEKIDCPNCRQKLTRQMIHPIFL